MTEKIEWFKFRRGGIAFGRVYLVLRGNKKYFKQYYGVDCGHHIYYGNSEKLEWYLSKDFTLQLGHRLIKELFANSPFSDEMRQKWNEFYDQIRKISDEFMFQQDLSKFSAKQLAKEYGEWIELSSKFCGFTNTAIDGIDEAMLVEIRELINKIETNQTRIEDLLKILLIPSESTYIQRRSLAVMTLVDKIMKTSQTNLDKWQDQIMIIETGYWWTPIGWMTKNIFNQSVIRAEIKHFLSDPNFNKNFNHLKNLQKETYDSKKEVLQQINNEDLNRLLEVYEEIAKLHDWKKEAEARLLGMNEKFFLEIVRRNGNLSTTDLDWLTYEEVIEYLEDGKKDWVGLVARRKATTICYVDGEQMTMLEGEAATVLRDQLVEQRENKKIKKIKGRVASVGQARGEAIVSDDPHFLRENIREGQILVTAQTTPDFVPIMRKAAAIVTDEGGATCHAAIISRELKKPCIVGTKFATEMISTGDIIDVDADKGVVKIL